jgi:hypothetical protein
MRVLLALLASFCSIAVAADSFSGKWSSSQSDAGGTIQIQVAEPASVSFTFGGEEVKTKMLTVKKDGSLIELRYEFNLMGGKLVSTLTGKLTGDKFEGKYQTTPAEGGGAVDNGEFAATAR